MSLELKSRVGIVQSTRKSLIPLTSLVASLCMATPAGATPTTNTGQAYVDECVAAGVPEPPPWNYEFAWHGVNSDWIKLDGVLEVSLAGSPNELPDDPSSRPVYTEVFYYESTDPASPGICYALPRGVWDFGEVPENGPPVYIQLMGVICQGRNTGKACFWDSGVNYITNGLPPGKTLNFGNGDHLGPASLVSAFAGGGNLSTADNCTGCHIGDNAFIVHPDTQLGVPDPRMPLAGYDPIMRSELLNVWFPSKSFASLDPEDGCVTCHSGPVVGGRLPQLSTETNKFCETILKGTWGLTMPYSFGAPLVPFDGVAQEPGDEDPYLDGVFQGTGIFEVEDAPPGVETGNYAMLLTQCRTAPPLESSRFKVIGSMDGPAESNWSQPQGTGTLSDVTAPLTEGGAAMQVDTNGYAMILSNSIKSWGFTQVGTKMEVDVYVPPTGQPNPYWLGAVQLFVTVPSAYMVNAYAGQVELTPGGTGWRTAEFTLSQEVLNALRAPHPDVRFGIAVNTPQGAPPLVLDDFKFTGDLEDPATIPTIFHQYNFENGFFWSGIDGGIASVGSSGDVAYQGDTSLRVDLDTASDARVWTVPTASLAPGDTVTFEVFIPAGAPVVGIQPYIADANFAWGESWNTSFPYNGWVTVAATVPEYATLPAQELGVKFYVDSYYNGPVYIDAVWW